MSPDAVAPHLEFHSNQDILIGACVFNVSWVRRGPETTSPKSLIVFLIYQYSFALRQGLFERLYAVFQCLNSTFGSSCCIYSFLSTFKRRFAWGLRLHCYRHHAAGYEQRSYARYTGAVSKLHDPTLQRVTRSYIFGLTINTHGKDKRSNSFTSSTQRLSNAWSL